MFQRVRARIVNSWYCWIRNPDPGEVERPFREEYTQSCRKRRDRTRFTLPSVQIMPASSYARRTSISGAGCWWLAATVSCSRWWTGSSRGPIGKKPYTNYHSVWYLAARATAWQNLSLMLSSMFFSTICFFDAYLINTTCNCKLTFENRLVLFITKSQMVFSEFQCKWIYISHCYIISSRQTVLYVIRVVKFSIRKFFINHLHFNA